MTNLMSKSKWNFIIDVIMFILMGLLAGIGLLIKYVLLSGSEKWEKFSTNVEMTYWGMDRHEWGKIHLIVAIVLIVFLILHIILHWKTIVCLYKKFSSSANYRIAGGILLVILTVILVIFPFLINPEISTQATGRERFTKEQVTESRKEPSIRKSTTENRTGEKVTGRRNQTAEPDKRKYTEEEEHHHIDDPSIEIKGFMTINEVSEEYQVPCSYIKEKLNLPQTVSNASKLGHLRKEYGFKMSELETIVTLYKKEKQIQ